MAPFSIPLLAASCLLLLAIHAPLASAQPGELTSFSASVSPWLPSQNRTLISPKRIFAAGFRPHSEACDSSSSPSADGYIFSIWVPGAADRTVVWSLNCSIPVAGATPLVLSPSGVLTLNDSSGRNLWPGEVKPSSGAELTLGDDGHLVFGNWSSLDYPTDTILPNQGLEGKTLTSRNGRYRFVNASSLILLGDRGPSYWVIGLKNLSSDGVLFRQGAQPYITSDVGARCLRRMTLDVDGNLRIFSFLLRRQAWEVVWQAVQEPCRIHGTCGDNSICFSNGSSAAVQCLCPPGFRPSGERTCVRKVSYLQGSKFLRLDFVNFAEGGDHIQLPPVTLEACQSRCLGNTSCVGFTYKFTGEQYCVHHSGVLVDGYWSPASQAAMFLRVGVSETDVSTFTSMAAVMDTVCPLRVSLPLPPKESKTTARNLAIIGTAFALELLAGVLSFWAFLRRYSRYRDMASAFGLELFPAGGPKRFSYAELKAATDDFTNAIGQGGFGVVYKGELPDHRVVAVKRLKAVTGGEADFWAEVTIIARMHHLNLVRLWGFCAEKDQRLLVYEYIPNGSLDKYIFPQPGEKLALNWEQEQERSQSGRMAAAAGRQKPLLDWGIRYRIAVGVARAIAYLHEECLEWVLHRDIKPENILLDDDFCPKVSDFGLAKLTKDGEDRVSRSRVRGTQGYMAPEWVMSREAITAKADVYSFGMVLLEMVTGVRNSQFRRTSMQSEDWCLPEFAYEKVYRERSMEEVLDPRILGSYDTRAHFDMVERMVKTAMWCLQARPEMRPSMGKVAKMLEGTVEITEPGKPTIFCLRGAG